jgi:hypothetical protein
MIFSVSPSPSRISLILNSISLHLNIHFIHRRHQIELLSNHLKFHSDQVVSLEVYDETYDQTNLHSCIFYAINSSSKLEIVFEKLSKLSKLVVFRIIQYHTAEEDKLNPSDVHRYSRLILVYTPSMFHLADLFFHYNHSQIATTSIVITIAFCNNQKYRRTNESFDKVSLSLKF